MTHKLTINEIQERLEDREIKLIGKYKDSSTKTLFLCKHCNKKWFALPFNIFSGHGCPSCSHVSPKITIQEVNDRIKNRKIKLIEGYINTNKQALFECLVCHYKWHTIPQYILKGNGCPNCYGNIPLTIDFCREFARKEHNGDCLSTIYINNKTNLKWKCNKGHTWEAKPHNVISNHSWCPNCQNSIREGLSRKIMENIFNCGFLKAVTPWLKIGYKRHLHLDGYNEERKIAFEYQGPQHYEQVNWLKNDINKQKENDHLKQQLCRENHVTLLIIPYWIIMNKLMQFIRMQFKLLTGKDAPSKT